MDGFASWSGEQTRFHVCLWGWLARRLGVGPGVFFICLLGDRWGAPVGGAVGVWPVGGRYSSSPESLSPDWSASGFSSPAFSSPGFSSPWASGLGCSSWSGLSDVALVSVIDGLLFGIVAAAMRLMPAPVNGSGPCCLFPSGVFYG